jgi:hypothetical protein
MNLPSLRYPLVVADEQRAINRVSVWASMLRHRMEKEYSREWLETELQKGLREGRLTLTIKAVEAADAGDEIADGALRDIGAELQVALVQGRELAPGHLQVIAYFQRAGRRAPHKRKRGHAWYDDWIRNFAICILVQLACAEYGVPPTRSRGSRRADRRLSGVSLVTAALARNRVNLDEGTVQQHIWFGLWGELARQFVAERPIEMLVAAIHSQFSD